MISYYFETRFLPIWRQQPPLAHPYAAFFGGELTRGTFVRGNNASLHLRDGVEEEGYSAAAPRLAWPLLGLWEAGGHS